VKVYILSGLAADKDVFEQIPFPDKIEPVFLDWIEPRAKESLGAYARRFIAFINTDEAFGLAGLSFGGMLVSEIARTTEPKFCILISSASNRNEIPFHLRWIPRWFIRSCTIKLSRVLPLSLHYKTFGAQTPREKELLKRYMVNMRNPWYHEHLRMICSWKQTDTTCKVVRIHALKDHILPWSNSQKPDLLLVGGGHFAVHREGEKISAFIDTL
jgi:hypothetical protein